MQSGSRTFIDKLKSYDLDVQEFIAGFGDEPTTAFEFVESPKMSTYLFCFIAGPYVTFESD